MALDAPNSKVRDPSRFLRHEVGGGVQLPHLGNPARGDEYLAAQTIAMQGRLSIYGDFEPVVGQGSVVAEEDRDCRECGVRRRLEWRTPGCW